MTAILHTGSELADLRAEHERRAGVGRAQAELRAEGALACDDCALPIDDARRKAAPFARRCINCQRIHENASRRRCA